MSGSHFPGGYAVSNKRRNHLDYALLTIVGQRPNVFKVN